MIVDEERGDDLSVLSNGIDPNVECIEVVIDCTLGADRALFNMPQAEADRITRIVFGMSCWNSDNCERLLAATPRPSCLEQLECAFTSKTQPIVLEMIRSSAHLRCLVLHGCSSAFSEESFESVRDRWACLKELTVTVKNCTESVVVLIAQCSPRVHKLCIDDVCWPFIPVTLEQGMVQIAKCYDLRELTLKWFAPTEASLVHLLAESCPRLWKLDTPQKQ